MMSIIHYAGIAAVPVLIGGYLAAIRWATRSDEAARRANGR
jgi:hypothetical protein